MLSYPSSPPVYTRISMALVLHYILSSSRLERRLSLSQMQFHIGFEFEVVSFEITVSKTPTFYVAIVFKFRGMLRVQDSIVLTYP